MEIRPYHCSIEGCKKTFYRKYLLVKHQERRHPNEVKNSEKPNYFKLDSKKNLDGEIKLGFKEIFRITRPKTSIESPVDPQMESQKTKFTSYESK